MYRSGSVYVLGTCLFLLSSCGSSNPQPSSPAAESPRKITAAVGTTANMPRSDKRPKYNVDQVGNIMEPTADRTIDIPGSANLVVGGWAADEKPSAPAAVEIAIDSVPYAAECGKDRTDVASHFKRPELAKSGFHFSIPASELSPGNHTVAVRIINPGNTAYFETAPYQIVIR